MDFDKIIEDLNNGKLEKIGRGNSSICYKIDDENIMLERSANFSEELKKEIKKNKELNEKINRLKEKGVNVVNIKGSYYSDGKLYTIQERAKGFIKIINEN